MAVIIAVAFGLGAMRGMFAVPGPLPQDGAVVTAVIVQEPVAGIKSVSAILVGGRRILLPTDSLGLAGFGDLVRLRCVSWTWSSRFAAPRCRPTGVEVIALHREGPVRAVLHRVSSWFADSIRRALPSPEAPFLAGLLLGSRDEIPAELTGDFRASGTSHIVAVSGYNVTIVVALIGTIVSRMPFPRPLRLSLVLFSIAGFVGITGASASVVRAGIMGSIAVVGREAGRVTDASHILLLAAAAMIVADPTVVSSIGFQLSVASTYGLLAFGDALSKRLSFMPKAAELRTSLASTLSAVAATSPIIMLYFGQFSIVAPFVNLIVLPLVPIAMLAGFVIAVVCAVVPAVVPYVAWIGWVPLKAIIIVVTNAARLPFASVTLGGSVSLAVALIGALIVSYAAVKLRNGHARR